MDKIVIRGGKPLKGSITVGGAKNAALPLMTASLLTDEPLVLTNVPRLADIATLETLLRELGVEAERTPAGGRLALLSRSVKNHTAPYDLVRKMRASFLVLGPLLARFRQARVSLPGGCAIGPRPVDLHLKAMEALGAHIRLEDGYVDATAPSGLTGGRVRFPTVSVGATENVLMAATLARGETVIENAAREPEIVDLAECLVAMGAKISGIGSERLVVQGVEKLSGANHSVIPDRIEAGSYAIAAAATGGDIELVGARADIMEAVVESLRKAGVVVATTDKGIRVAANGEAYVGFDVQTQPYPGFPTDMQAQMMVLMAMGGGASMITETIFENRYMHVPELARMGADIVVHGSSAMVRGKGRLIGAPVMATDLRASMCLVLAGLAAEGKTEVNRIYHLDRGYERLEEKLKAVGADLERVKA
jgi:UDP-N-acetylglucosamine 1-carboxyvinyltransferase